MANKTVQDLSLHSGNVAATTELEVHRNGQAASERAPLSLLIGDHEADTTTHGITAAAATVLDDATVAAMVDTLGGAASTGTGGLARATSPTFVTPALGTPSALVGTNITGTAAGLTAGNVTTNANLTGHVTSVGNAAVLGSFTVAQLNTALSDGNITSDSDLATHEADVTTHGITAAAATVLDDATVAAMVDTLGGASATGTGGLVRATGPTITLANATGLPTAGLDNDAVTYAKMQNISAGQRILGRISTSGDPEEITHTTAAQQLCDDASFTAMRTTLGLAIGTDVQAWSAILDAIAAGNFFQITRKTADETIDSGSFGSRANSTTLGDDTHLIVALAATTTYTIRGTIYFNSGVNPDFKYALNYSGTTTGNITSHIQSYPAGTTPGVDALTVGVTNAAVGSTNLVSAGTTGDRGRLYFEQVFTTNSAGNFSFQWAQQNSHSDDTTVLKGSFLERMVIA